MIENQTMLAYQLGGERDTSGPRKVGGVGIKQQNLGPGEAAKFTKAYQYTRGSGTGHRDNIGNSLQMYAVIQRFHIAGRPCKRKLKQGRGLGGVQLLARIYFLTPTPTPSWPGSESQR